MPVLMAGAMRVSTTRRASMPTGAPPNSSAGIVHCGWRAAAISLIARVVATASRKPPAPTKPATAGAAAMANAPRPIASRIAESPISGLASAALKPGKYRPCGISTGAVNAEVGAVARHVGDDGRAGNAARRVEHALAHGHRHVEKKLVVGADELQRLDAFRQPRRQGPQQEGGAGDIALVHLVAHRQAARNQRVERNAVHRGQGAA